jgi:subtilisin
MDGKVNSQGGANSLMSMTVITFAIPLLSYSILNSVSPISLFEVEAQPGSTSSLQGKLNDLRNNTSNSEKKFRETNGEKIPNQYIVVLEDDFLSSPGNSALKARSQGAELKHVYQHALKGYAISVPNDKTLDDVMKNPEVDYVQPDIKVEAFVQSLPTGINRVDGELSSTKSGDGGGTVNVDIAIMDTGIQLSHADLNVYREVTFVSGTSSGNDDNGHGTSVAGIAAAKDDSSGVVGIAPGARLWAIKVLDNNGIGSTSDILEGVDYVTEHADEIDVVNLSFGGQGSNDALRSAIIGSVAAGVTYVAAAGNNAMDASSFSPASFPEVIAVSAIVDYDGKCGGVSSITTSAGGDDTFASFSNYGSVIDMAAPGVQITTTTRGSSYSSMSGTSASAPHVTGAAALYESEHPGSSPSVIRNALRNVGSSPAIICDGNGHGYFTGDPDNNAEPLLYIGTAGVSGKYRYPPSLSLTGSNYHDTPNSPSLQLSQFSVAAWFKTSTNFGSNALIVNKGGFGSDSSGQNLNYGIWMTSSEQIKAGFETINGADQFVTSPNTYNDGQWHYVVVTYGGSSVILYVDGVQVATKSTSGASAETSGIKPVRVGANSRVTPPGNFFTGEVDEVRVWNDDLTSLQVADAFAGTSFNLIEHVLYLDFSSFALSRKYTYEPSLSLSGHSS